MGKQNSKLMPEEFSDLRNVAHFTERELQIWYRDFLRDFPDGSVTKNEFREIYMDNFPYGDPASFTGHVFRIYDTNNDGKIDFREFITAVSGCCVGITRTLPFL